MWRARHTLEEQVGGLIDHDEDDRPGRRRVEGPAEPTGYPLARQGSAAIRAERAASPTERRQVA